MMTGGRDSKMGGFMGMEIAVGKERFVWNM